MKVCRECRVEVDGHRGHFDVQAAMREGEGEVVDDFLILQDARLRLRWKAARQKIEDGVHVLLHRFEAYGSTFA